MTKSARLAILSAGAFAALAAPSAAVAAPTFQQPLKACYVSVGEADDEREPIAIDADGFAPNSMVDVAVNGTVVTTQQADAVGDLPAGTVAAPFQERGEAPFTVSLTQQDNPANTVSATSKVTALELNVRPRRARPSSRVRFTGAGFTADAPVYAHYVFRGRQRKRVLLARPHGDCGRFRVRKRQIPVRNPGSGTWTLQVDQQRRYSVSPETVFVRLNIIVQRVVPTP
jgi:hypothetical protein